MKRVVIFLLVAVMVFGMVGCGGPQAAEPDAIPQTSEEVVRETDVNKFIENYKRTDVAVLPENLGEFVADLYATLDGLASADFSAWTVPEDIPDDWPYNEYQIETVLFNLPASVYVANYSGENETTESHIGIFFSTDDRQNDIDIANAMCEYALKEYGDADIIEVIDTSTLDHAEITEHDWRGEYYEQGNCSLVWEATVGAYVETLSVGSYSWKYSSEVSISVTRVDANE